jgi:hypothetical protein
LEINIEKYLKSFVKLTEPKDISKYIYVAINIRTYKKVLFAFLDVTNEKMHIMVSNNEETC